MASGIVKDIDEKFCQCSVCLGQFKEPKMLPCLHRFCKNCLTEMIQKNRVKIACPECLEECLVPKEGSDGFRTDFYMKNIIEYIHLQKTLDAEKAQECYGCSKIRRVSAYCFRCNGFLCKECHRFHVTSKITKDHRPNLLAPTCYTHSEKVSELCCKTCSNMPICVACTYGNHKSHDIHEITALANEGRQNLEQKVAEVCTFEEEILQMPEKLEELRNNINAVVSDKLKSSQSDYSRIQKCVRGKLVSLGNASTLSISRKEIALNEELKLIESEMEAHMRKIKEKYDKICEEKRRTMNFDIEMIQRRHKEAASVLQERLFVTEQDFKMAKASLEKQRRDNLHKLQEISSHFESTTKRLKNLKDTASSLLKPKNDWAVIQCVPGIFETCNPLIADMQRSPDLESLVKIDHKRLSFASRYCQTHISDQSSVFDIVGTSDMGWDICDVAVSQSGDIVLTGNAAEHDSHITIIDEEGKVKRQWIMSDLSGSLIAPDRFCDFLSEDTIATTADPNEIGIFNIRDGSYVKTNISDVTSDWPEERGVTCIATDPSTKQIIVGSSEGPLLCMFDGRLNFVRSLTLPKPMMDATDILFHKKKSVVVCGMTSVFVMTFNGPHGENVFEFPKPFTGGENWQPLNICKEKSGFIYILWKSEEEGGQRVIAKYGLHGFQVLAVQDVENDTSNITTAVLGNKEILLTTSFSTRKMYQYDLVPQN